MHVQVSQLVGKLQEMFSEHLDLSDLKKHQGDQLSDKIQTRCIAAYGVHWLSGCSLELASKSVTDCDKDNGIDALYYDEHRKRLVIVQSKLIKNGNSEPSASEVRDFRSGIYDLIESRLEKFDARISGKTLELSKIREFGTKFDIILAYTSRDELAKPATDAISEMMGDLNGDDSDDDPCFTFHLLSRRKMTEALTLSIGQKNIDIEFLLREYGVVDDPYRAYFGKIEGTKLAEWWNNFADGLFRDNIRNSLGQTPVNASITKTITEKPDLFWYFNNGITVICDEIKKTAENGNKRDFGFFKAVNASIVNGAQTYSAIGKAVKKGANVEALSVSFRVIETGKNSDPLKDEITRHNNTQNSILPRDFVSQDPNQTNLQQQVSLSGYDYILKRDEVVALGQKTISLDKAIESLVMVSVRPNLAALYRKEIGRLQNPETPQYKSLFNESTNPILFINAFELNSKLDLAIQNVSQRLKAKGGSLPRIDNICNSGSLIIKQVYYKNLSATTHHSMATSLFPQTVEESRLEKELESTVSLVNRDYTSNYIVTLFQNAEKCATIVEKL
jgi:hypothetical protein